MAFGEFLRLLRNNNKISQEELADKIDCSAKHISRLENDTQVPSIEHINKLSSFFKLDLYSHYEILKYRGDSDFYNNVCDLESYISNSDFINAQNLIESLKSIILSGSYHDIQIIQYYEIRILVLKKEYSRAIELSKKYLSKQRDYIKNPTQYFILSEYTYKMLSLLNLSLLYIGNSTDAIRYSKSLINNLKHNFITPKDSLIHKNSCHLQVYLIELNNLANYYIHIGSYELALSTINECIDYLTQLKLTENEFSIYMTKFECLYHLDEYELASKILIYLLLRLKLEENNELYNSIVEKTKTEFSKFDIDSVIVTIESIY